MKLLLVLLLLAIPVVGWGWTKKPVVDDAKKDAIEDVCFAYSEFFIAYNEYSNKCIGGYTTGSPCFRIVEKKQITLRRLLALQERYVKRFGSELVVYPPQSSSGPTLCR